MKRSNRNGTVRGFVTATVATLRKKEMRGVFPGEQLGRPAICKQSKKHPAYAASVALLRPAIREMRNTGEKMTDTLWKCEQWRAGKVYNKVLFNTQAEAESFAAKMRGLEPDPAMDGRADTGQPGMELSMRR